MNYINDYVLKYHEYLKNLSNDVSEICEDSRYILGKYADIRWDILVQVWIQRDSRSRGLKTEAIIFDEARELSEEDLKIIEQLNNAFKTNTGHTMCGDIDCKPINMEDIIKVTK